MEIAYIYCKCPKRKILVSTSRHDCNTCNKCKSAIDGGFSGYIRIIGSDIIVHRKSIEKLIVPIRKRFHWTTTQDKRGHKIEPITKLLHELDSDHILNILIYLNNKTYQKLLLLQSTEKLDLIHDSPVDANLLIIIEIFTEELKYRMKKGIL